MGAIYPAFRPHVMHAVHVLCMQATCHACRQHLSRVGHIFFMRTTSTACRPHLCMQTTSMHADHIYACRPHLLHAGHISQHIIVLDLAKNINYEAPHYAFYANLLLHYLSGATYTRLLHLIGLPLKCYSVMYVYKLELSILDMFRKTDHSLVVKYEDDYNVCTRVRYFKIYNLFDMREKLNHLHTFKTWGFI
jgi:hypothetical protein